MVSALADLGSARSSVGPEVVDALAPSGSGSTAAELQPEWIMAGHPKSYAGFA